MRFAVRRRHAGWRAMWSAVVAGGVLAVGGVITTVDPPAAFALNNFELQAVDPSSARVGPVNLSSLEISGGQLAGIPFDITAGAFTGTAVIAGSMSGDSLVGWVEYTVTSTDNYGMECTSEERIEFSTSPITTAGEVVTLTTGAFVSRDICPDLIERSGESVATIDYTVIDRSPPGTEATDTTLAEEEPQGFVERSSGTAYYSPASEADKEPFERTWLPLQPGERVPLGDGAMLRTGPDGTITVRYGTGSLMGMQPSTLYTIGRPTLDPTPQRVIYGRLWEGLVNYWNQGLNEEFEVETDRANTSVEGTVWQLAASATSTRVSVFEGTVTVTPPATGLATPVPAGQTATVDDSGITLLSNEQAGAVRPSAPDIADAPAAGGSSSRSGVPVLGVVLAIAAALVAAGVAVAARRPRPVR